MTMPVVFAGHGSPMNVLEENAFTQGWADMGQRIPRPRAILCISAHWYEPGDAVSGAEHPETIHDYYGFPPALYDVTYPAPGAPELARETALLSGQISVEPERGLDHGAWSVLRSMYPHADIPVCQLSVNSGNTPRQSYEMGEKLRPLREKGVLILGSGDVVHNLARIDWDREDGFPWADAFDAAIRDAILAGRHEDVIEYHRAGDAARMAFSRRDHYDPLLYALGACGTQEPVTVFNDARVLGSLSMTSFLIG